jgi:hypothetical protein
MRKMLTMIVTLIPIFLYGQKAIFIPDTSVSGIKLQDPISLTSKIQNIRALIDDSGPEGQAFILNKDNSEILILTFHAGTSWDRVAEFHIAANKQGTNYRKSIKLNIDRFVTESSIKLYMTKSDLIKIKGGNYKLEKVSDNEILKYEIDDYLTSQFLGRYNYPEYYEIYTFHKDRLIIIYFGFEYP